MHVLRLRTGEFVCPAQVRSSVGQNGDLVSDFGHGYADLNGTSMATPHVSAAAALLWAQFPAANAASIRSALTTTAEDLGAAGRDDFYGAGLLRVDSAYDYMVNAPACLPLGNACSTGSDCCSGTCSGKPNQTKTCK